MLCRNRETFTLMWLPLRAAISRPCYILSLLGYTCISRAPLVAWTNESINSTESPRFPFPRLFALQMHLQPLESMLGSSFAVLLSLRSFSEDEKAWSCQSQNFPQQKRLRFCCCPSTVSQFDIKTWFFLIFSTHLTTIYSNRHYEFIVTIIVHFKIYVLQF